MDNSIACPRCGANLVFQSNLDTTPSETICDFCGAHLSVTYENNLPQFTLLPDPEAAAPDLAQFAPEAAPAAGTPTSIEPVPTFDPAPEQAPEPAPEPSPIPQESFSPQDIPSPITGDTSLPVAETPFSSFTPQEPPQKKGMNPWMIVAIVIVVVLCLCCVCGGLGALLFINSGSTSSTLVPFAGLIF